MVSTFLVNADDSESAIEVEDGIALRVAIARDSAVTEMIVFPFHAGEKSCGKRLGGQFFLILFLFHFLI